MLYFWLVVIIIILIVNNNDNKKFQERLQKKIKDLEEELSHYKNTSLEQNQNNVLPQQETKQQVPTMARVEAYHENIKINNNIPKKEKNDEGIKNKFILMTGAVLIVLAAIVFLTSTWHTIPDIIKTSVIILLAGVFIGASNIAKKVFKLEETANTFLYIALAYLPISLFSISLFGLIGNYLSIYGDGSNLYFAITSGFLAILYFSIGNHRKHYVLIHSSMIMQLLAVIFISLCIHKTFSTVILGVIIYNTILFIIKKNNSNKYSNILNIYNNIYLYGSFIIELLLLISGNSVVDSISNAILIFNFCLNYKENSKFLSITLVLTQLLVFAISCMHNIIYIELKQLAFYILLIIIYSIGILNKKTEWKESSMLVTNIAMILLYFSTLIHINDIVLNISLKPYPYIVLSTIAILNIINYNISNRKELFINIIPLLIFGATIDTIIENSLNFYYLIIMELSIFAFSILNLLKGQKSNYYLQNYSNALTLISVVIGLIANNNILKNPLIFFLIIIVYILAYLKNRDIKIYKLIAYLLLNVFLYSISYRYELDQFNKYILFITTIISTLIELNINSTKNDVSIIYIVLSYIISFIILNIDITITSFISILILGIMFVLYNNNKQIDKHLVIIPFMAIIPSVYFSNWATIHEINYMAIASFALIIITTILSIRKGKINIFTIISGIYLLMQLFTLELNIYLNLILAIIWSILHFIKMKTNKPLFEVLSYILVLVFYNTLIIDSSKIDISLESITAFKYLGYIIFCICISRNILKKHFADGYKYIEYIVFTILYISAISNYSDEIDGMIFVFMLVCIIMFSYIKKYGPIFFTSTIAVLFNVFLLTREFWFSIPWWIYMLVIGSTLILFAVRNELNENKQKDIIKTKIKSFKEYMNM